MEKHPFEPQPSAAEKERLGRLLLLYLATKKSRKRRPVMEFLFSELARMGDKPELIKAVHVIEATRGTVTPAAESTMRAMVSRLNEACDRFFNEWEEGRREKWRVYFNHGNYLPQFGLNTPTAKTNDFLGDLWLPYKESLNPTRLLYPEPQFFIDPQDTYLRNPEANTPGSKRRFQYLSEWKELKPSYSFVPSGIVAAMLSIIACFRRWNQEIVVEPLRPHDLVPETHDNLIVLGTPTSTNSISILESPLILRTHHREIKIAGHKSVSDSGSEYVESDAPEFVKWGTLTRRYHRFDDRLVTVLAAGHGRTVDAMAQLLTNPSDVVRLADKLERPQRFPDCFQALFRVEMIRSDTGPQINRTRVEKAFIQSIA